MCQNNNNTTIDAYKSIIDFNKTIITIASSILTALIAYIVYQNIDLRLLNYLSILLVMLSILLSLYGFGSSIQTVKDGVSRKGTILMTNIAGFFLIAGILLLLSFNHKKEKNIDEILTTIESSTTRLQQSLSPEKIKSIELKNNIYTIIFDVDSLEKTVKYSTGDDMILSIK